MPRMIFSGAPFPLPSPSTGAVSVTESYVYSTGMIGVGAKGRLRLFTTPLGQSMPSIGADKLDHPVLEDKHTNLHRAGELGHDVGDASFRTIRVVSHDLGRDVEARISIVVSGMVQFSSPLAPLLNRETREFKVPILAARTDTLEAVIEFDEPAHEMDVPTGRAFLRVELGGMFARDEL